MNIIKHIERRFRWCVASEMKIVIVEIQTISLRSTSSDRSRRAARDLHLGERGAGHACGAACLHVSFTERIPSASGKRVATADRAVSGRVARLLGRVHGIQLSANYCRK
jgi:hypothetical protein